MEKKRNPLLLQSGTMVDGARGGQGTPSNSSQGIVWAPLAFRKWSIIQMSWPAFDLRDAPAQP